MSVPHVVFRAEKGPHFSDNNAVMVISLESDGFGIKVHRVGAGHAFCVLPYRISSVWGRVAYEREMLLMVFYHVSSS